MIFKIAVNFVNVLWVAFSIPPGSLSHMKYPVFILHKIMIYISIYIYFNPKFASSVCATFHVISSKIAALPIIYLPNRNFCTTK
jgi:hypothetical protein